MPRLGWQVRSRHRVLAAVTALQAGSALFFLIDVLSELDTMHAGPVHTLLEAVAVVALILGTIVGLRQMSRALRRNERMEGRMRAASGAFVELLDDTFTLWALTPSERDVALLLMKGINVAGIAALRETRAGTVKAQCAAVYRKSRVGGRTELLDAVTAP